MHLETFAKGDSPLHCLDPRAKLVAAAAYSLVVGLGTTLALGWAALGVALAAVLVARLPLGSVARRLGAVNLFMALLWVMLPLRLVPAPASFWGLSWEWDPAGLRLAGVITLKANAIALVLMALLATSTINDLFHALAHLRVPTKLVQIFLFFYRYLHVLHQEYHRLTQAMRARGFAPGNNLHTYRSYAHLAGVLLVRSYDRAQRVYQAMLCRGYTGTLWLLDHFTWGSRENLFLVISSLIIAALSWLALESSTWT
jgi:cobalt/nickel transport system permease protein